MLFGNLAQHEVSGRHVLAFFENEKGRITGLFKIALLQQHFHIMHVWLKLKYAVRGDQGPAARWISFDPDGDFFERLARIVSIEVGHSGSSP